MRRQGKIVCMMLVGLLALFAVADTDAANSAGQGFRIIRGEGSVCAAGHGVIQFHGTGDLVAEAGESVIAAAANGLVCGDRGMGSASLSFGRRSFASSWL